MINGAKGARESGGPGDVNARSLHKTRETNGCFEEILRRETEAAAPTEPLTEMPDPELPRFSKVRELEEGIAAAQRYRTSIPSPLIPSCDSNNDDDDAVGIMEYTVAVGAGRNACEEKEDQCRADAPAESEPAADAFTTNLGIDNAPLQEPVAMSPTAADDHVCGECGSLLSLEDRRKKQCSTCGSPLN
jgi:hypothetical protein